MPEAGATEGSNSRRAHTHTHTHTHTNAHAHIYSNVYIKKEKMPKGQGTHTWPFELHNSTPQHTNSLTKEFTYHICTSKAQQSSSGKHQGQGKMNKMRKNDSYPVFLKGGGVGGFVLHYGRGLGTKYPTTNMFLYSCAYPQGTHSWGPR